MAVERGSSQLRVALDVLGCAFIEIDRWGEGHRVATHNFITRVCQPQWVWRLRARTRARTELRLSSPNAEQVAGESGPIRWTCTFRGLAGGKGRAAFDSMAEARRFGDMHANLTSAPVNDWAQLGDSWVLSTQLGQYVIRPTNTRIE
jgi:hypothetical protein